MRNNRLLNLAEVLKARRRPASKVQFKPKVIGIPALPSAIASPSLTGPTTLARKAVGVRGLSSGDGPEGRRLDNRLAQEVADAGCNITSMLIRASHVRVLT
jgi:hypothetical protein